MHFNCKIGRNINLCHSGNMKQEAFILSLALVAFFVSGLACLSCESKWAHGIRGTKRRIPLT
jgi:hypothetical protein